MDDRAATLFLEAVPNGDSNPKSTPTNARYLIVLDGDTPGAVLPLRAGLQRIGRTTECELHLSEPTISRQHAHIVIDGRGQAWLTDLGSTNGTQHNGNRLETAQPVPLRDGDRVRIGSRLMVKYACTDAREAEFQRELFERTVRDPLTGLYHRAYFQERIGPLATTAHASGLGVALLMLDIDHFKRINDTLGHPAGDQVLCEVASVIRASTRADDLVARYGGEEFVAALPIASAQHALDRAERIRTAISERRMFASGKRLSITASIGLAFSPVNKPRTARELITIADQSLYHAKNSGRDRVAAFLGSNEPEPTPQTTVDYDLEAIWPGGECPVENARAAS